MNPTHSIARPDIANAALRESAQDRISTLVTTASPMSLENLRALWRQQFGRQANAALSRNLLYRLMLYRVQADEFGDLAPNIERQLDQIGKDGAREFSIGNPDQGNLRPGTILVREHAGGRHQVTVTQTGFSWNSKEFASLSAVAFAITGTKWNGRRFFGLRGAVNGKI